MVHACRPDMAKADSPTPTDSSPGLGYGLRRSAFGEHEVEQGIPVTSLDVSRIQLERANKLLLGRRPVPGAHQTSHCQGAVSFSERRIDRYRAPSGLHPLGQNNVPGVNNLMHNNSYGVAAEFLPNEKVSVDLGYSYNDISTSLLVCFTASG
jgi:hypothetical protein